ncbi:phage recombination protein Bet [Arcobacter sp.]|uniref:phage recombination protein Bet n=1 Tax=Arcobacter sp. TaxID=1872629 RepID=UPI003D13C0AC
MNNIVKGCNVTYESENGNVQLSLDIVRNVIAKGKDFTEMEIYSFIKLCQYQRLNPFLGEAHLIKFGDNVQMVVGIDVFTNRLDEHPLCEGWKAGLILLKDNNVTERTGTFYLKNHGEQIVGAWFKAQRSDWKTEFEWSVTFSEFYKEYYDKKSQKTKPLKNWAEMPATMIVKCAIASGARKLFTKDFKGVYSSEEIGIDVNQDNIIDIPIDDNKKDNNETINKDDIDKIYKSMKSNIIKLSTEEEYKIIEYVISKLIKNNQLKKEVVLSTIPKDKLSLVIEGTKQAIALYEKKELEKKSNDKNEEKIIEMEYKKEDNKSSETKDNKKTDKDNDNKKEDNKTQKTNEKKQEKKEEKTNEKDKTKK